MSDFDQRFEKVYDDYWCYPDKIGENDKIVLIIAKFIEVSGETIHGGSKPYKRNGQLYSLEEIWDLLSHKERKDRIKQALGAWVGIQGIGVDLVLQKTFESYIAEK